MIEQRPPTHVLVVEVPLHLAEERSFDAVGEALHTVLAVSRLAVEGVLCDAVQATLREVTFDRLNAAQCLKNAHGHIATAYAQIGGKLDTPGRRDRAVRETLDAVDWIRRACEHMAGSRV